MAPGRLSGRSASAAGQLDGLIGALGIRGPARRQAHHEPRAAAVERRLEADGAVVGLRDRADDREAQTARSPAVAGAAEEALEDLVTQLVGDPGAVVLDREHDDAVDALDLGLDRRARVGVAQRVL